jgi:hypothetical protein
MEPFAVRGRPATIWMRSGTSKPLSFEQHVFLEFPLDDFRGGTDNDSRMGILAVD